MSRSRAYPGVPLEECVKFLRQIKRALGPGLHGREAIADAIGCSASTLIRPVAAMAYYGLLRRDRDEYEITRLGRVLTDPLEGELRPGLREAFLSPKLYKELVGAFQEGGVIPAQLTTILHRKYDITENATNLAARVFVESAKFSGIVDDDCRFVDGDSSGPPESHNTGADDRDLKIPPGANDITSVSRLPAAIERTMAPSADSQEFRFRLTGDRFAVLVVPSELSKQDLNIIRKQIEIFDLQIEAASLES